MIATVNEQRQISLPESICTQLGIAPGAQLDLSVHAGKLEAVKVQSGDGDASIGSLRHLYTSERDAEELTIQKACSLDVPDDFPR